MLLSFTGKIMVEQKNSTQPQNFSTDNLLEAEGTSPAKPSRVLGQIWDGLIRVGLAEIVLRVGTAAVSFLFIMVIAWILSDFYLPGALSGDRRSIVQAASLAAQAPVADQEPAVLPEYITRLSGVSRKAMLHTIVPSRPRLEVQQYTVIPGDSIYGIAQRFNLQPETIFWGNYQVLADDVHRLSPGQVLNILPVDGVFYEWRAGNSLNQVAEFYGATPESVLTLPANHLISANIGDFDNTIIDPGTWLVIPGGRRGFVTWSAPRITREDPTVARVLGAGFCTGPMDGPIGSGTYTWPIEEHRIVGFDYSPPTNHYAIDIGTDSDPSILAVDAGVVVFAGWNDWGYGNVIVIDHGNGWQSLYAHLSSMDLGCGAYVYQGDVIGQMGQTGNASGMQLHFELRSDTVGRPNPLEYLQ
jgi:murein DD-endopeptidase MepM/ murein hydrolase activator NlpD